MNLDDLKRGVEQLKKKREELIQERADRPPADTNEATVHAQQATQLRQRITELLIEVGSKNRKETPKQPGKTETEEPLPKPTQPTPSVPGEQTPPPPDPPPTEPKTKHATVLLDSSPDPLLLAHSLFRAGDYSRALKEYRALQKGDRPAQDQLFIQYMLATCLRKLGNVEEAVVIYREVANSKGDKLLEENAQWHLGTIKWRQELEARLQGIKQQSKDLELKPK